MGKMHSPWMPAVLSSGIVAALLAWGSASALAQPAGVVGHQSTVVSVVHGAVGGSGGPQEPVIFSGQASISGKVIHDPDFGTPPVLEVVIDLSQVSGTGVQSRKTYLVSTQAVLHRPLLAFDPFELSFPFFLEGDGSPARWALASFGIHFNAARGMAVTPVTVKANRPN
ncbi:MAG: hypothetical protein ACRECD_10140 [Burkholderiaceae bacterium]